MNPIKPLRFAAAIVALGSLGSCRNRSSSDVMPRTPLYAHALHTGQTIAPVVIDCTDGRARVLAAPLELQLVTISSESDCVECERHLMGLDTIYAARLLPMDQFVLTHASLARRGDVLAVYHARTIKPTCIDKDAAFWHQTNVAHTPVTILLNGGQIEYIDDAPLESAKDRSLFTAEVIAAAKQ